MLSIGSGYRRCDARNREGDGEFSNEATPVLQPNSYQCGTQMTCHVVHADDWRRIGDSRRQPKLYGDDIGRDFTAAVICGVTGSEKYASYR